MKHKLFVLLVLGMSVMGLTAWLLYPRIAPAAKLPANAIAQFMHCPKCGTEYKYKAQLIDEGCSRCGYDDPLVPTEKSLAEMGDRPNPFVRMIAPLLVELNLLLVAIWFFSRANPFGAAREDEVEYLHTRCVKCKRRLRYAADRVGQQGRCPGCKYGLIFPGPVPDDLAHQQH